MHESDLICTRSHFPICRRKEEGHLPSHRLALPAASQNLLYPAEETHTRLSSPPHHPAVQRQHIALKQPRQPLNLPRFSSIEHLHLSSSMADLATVPEDQPTPSTSGSGSGSGLPPAAKAASEQAVKAAIAETVPSASAGKEKEDGEIDESAASPSKAKANGNGSSNGADSIQADGTGMRTVFSDPANFNVVHPLYSKWCVTWRRLGRSRHGATRGSVGHKPGRKS